MRRPGVAVSSGTPFKEIVQLMRRWDVDALPVVRGDGRVDGIVSVADLLPKEELRDPSRLPTDDTRAGAATAGRLMTSPAVSVRPDEPLAHVARLMGSWHLALLPVVDGEGLLTGSVSRQDVLRGFLRPDEDIADDIREQLWHLGPDAPETVAVRVRDGVVTLTGSVRGGRLTRAETRGLYTVEGVVDVVCRFTGEAGPPQDRTG
ncbi:CBS domain-containing protein [Streptomyces sp. B6B3]|uniref:CBS domain-containing protein n=1 Tax=Streptomyces sp. B6B3 TaxID=3153570 RepID=UPI00325E57C8